MKVTDGKPAAVHVMVAQVPMPGDGVGSALLLGRELPGFGTVYTFVQSMPAAPLPMFRTGTGEKSG